ncbi:hypothetical protein [Corynebacterium aurimucosum]|nr:hypothetical protein [Corynebacterium aurimucosum]
MKCPEFWKQTPPQEIIEIKADAEGQKLGALQFKGREMYSQFNRSVHHNVARQIEIAMSADIGSRGNAIETYEVAIRTAIAVGAAAFSLKEFRHCDDVDEAPLHLLADVFKSWSAYLDRLGDGGFVD